MIVLNLSNCNLDHFHVCHIKGTMLERGVAVFMPSWALRIEAMKEFGNIRIQGDLVALMMADQKNKGCMLSFSH